MVWRERTLGLLAEQCTRIRVPVNGDCLAVVVPLRRTLWTRISQSCRFPDHGTHSGVFRVSARGTKIALAVRRA
jgi:hypothetical protein